MRCGADLAQPQERQNSRAAFYHYEPLENGGPCGLCSRYLSLDRRVLWLIELTDLKLDAGAGVAPA
jgi:hypothetical protein